MDDRDRRPPGPPPWGPAWGPPGPPGPPGPARLPAPARPPVWPDPAAAERARRRRTAEAILKTLALYGFAGWAYIALNATFHPETLGLPLSHLASWPHEDTFGALCFAVSLLSFLALNLLRARADGD